tara:strand:- start:416 stop:613 length:198 start_codon:yes stop_codon:yes gene_type:complete
MSKNKLTKNKLNRKTVRVIELEDVMFKILNCSRLDIAKELAADIMEEDVGGYLEYDEDFGELDFE